MVAAAMALAGCESTNSLEPNQVTVVNLSDDFSFSVTALDNVSDGEQHLWGMTGTQVEVDVTQSISSGNAILQIRDGGGTVVYQENIGDAVDSTFAGLTGLWQVDVVLTKVSGEFSFTILRVP